MNGNLFAKQKIYSKCTLLFKHKVQNPGDNQSFLFKYNPEIKHITESINISYIVEN